jgi:hypothetical protein
MRAMLVFVLVFVLAVAQAAVTSPPCPKQSIGTPSAARVQPYFKYSYEMAKSSSTGSIYIDVDTMARSTQGLWLRVSADASTAYSASMHVKLTLNRVGTLNDSDWNAGSLTTGSFTQASTFGLPSSPFNITMGDKIWLTFFPTCATCSKTVEFSVETAWYMAGSTTNYPPIMLINNTRTMVFEQSQGTYTPFFTVVTSASYFYTSVVYDNKATSGSAEIVLYWTKDTPFNGTGTTLDQYPAGDGIIPGNYLTSRPFYANTTGTYYLTTYVKTESSGNTDSEFTIKVGFNSVPCASGSMLSVSLFVALLPFLASLWN